MRSALMPDPTKLKMIQSAPKDGTVVRLHRHDDGFECDGWLRDADFYWDEKTGKERWMEAVWINCATNAPLFFPPTHWRHKDGGK